jgi:hypothetical protein
MQERLEQFRARLETLTDSDFDAIMTKLGLSTAKKVRTQEPTPHKQPDTPKSTS